MSNRKLIGRVSATEKYPSSCDDFQFWLSDDAILSPFDIVRVENKTDDSVTYGVVQDILHITDGTGHLSNYVSSDFGNVDNAPMTRRLSLSYAKVSVIHNTKENFMPVFEGSPVYTADNDDIEIALGLDNVYGAHEAFTIENCSPIGTMSDDSLIFDAKHQNPQNFVEKFCPTLDTLVFGSPIIQDGKLVGAVTHVLVNDPTTGYGIFIENMLDAAA